MGVAAPIMPFINTIGTVLGIAQAGRSLFSKPPKPQAPMQMAAAPPAALTTPKEKRKNIMAAYGSLQSDDRNFVNRTTTFGLGG